MIAGGRSYRTKEAAESFRRCLLQLASPKPVRDLIVYSPTGSTLPPNSFAPVDVAELERIGIPDMIVNLLGSF